MEHNKTNHKIANHMQHKEHFFEDLMKAMQSQFEPDDLHFLFQYVLIHKEHLKIEKSFNCQTINSLDQPSNPLDINPYIFQVPSRNTHLKNKSNNRFRTQPANPHNNTPKMITSTLTFHNKKLLDLHRKLQKNYQSEISKRIINIDPIYFKRPQTHQKKIQFVPKFKKNIKTRQSQNNSSSIPSRFLAELNQTKSLNYFLSERICQTQSSKRKIL